MDKDTERAFLAALAKALEALPFDLKALAEALAEPDLDVAVQEIAASAIIHALNTKDGNTDPALRYAEDAILSRLALRRIAVEGGAGAAAFKERFADNYQSLDADLVQFRAALGDGLVNWIDGRWPVLKKAIYGKKPATKYVEDEALGATLYDDVRQFATDYPIAEGSLAERLKQAQPIIDHLARKKGDQDKMKISYH